MSEKKIKPIEPRWYSTLEFLGGMLEENNLSELVKEISDGYFKSKKENLLPTPTKLSEKDSVMDGNQLLGDDESCLFRAYSKCKHLDNYFLNELNLAHKIANEAGLHLAELQRILTEGNFFEPFNSAWAALDGEVQALIFRSLTPEKKEQFVKKIMNQNESWCKDEYYYEINDKFEFDSQGVRFAIKYLSECAECYLPQDNYPAHVKPFLLPIELGQYIDDTEAIRNLWLEYLNSNLPNRVYAGEVLALVKEERAIKPLLELLKMPLKDPYEKPHQEPENQPLRVVSYETQCKRPIIRAIQLIGKPALPFLEEIAANSSGNIKDIAKHIIEYVQRGDEPTKSLEAEVLIRKVFTEGIKTTYRVQREIIK